jgi:chromosome partitioning protein
VLFSNYTAELQEGTGVKVVSVVSSKGGAGKTTSAMNLAAVLSQSSRVLVVDTDPQGSAEWWAAEAGEDRPFHFAPQTDPEALKRLKALREYDIIVVDTPGTLEIADRLNAVMDSTDYAIVMAEAAPLAMKPALDTINQFLAPRNMPYRVLLNKVDPRSSLVDLQDMREYLESQDIPIFASSIRMYKAHERAPLRGVFVTQYGNDQYSLKAVEDYRKVALEMFTDWNRQQNEATA